MFVKGDKVVIKDGAKWANGREIAGWLLTSYDFLYVISCNGDTAVITCDKTLSAASGTIKVENLSLFEEKKPENEQKTAENDYKMLILSQVEEIKKILDEIVKKL